MRPYILPRTFPFDSFLTLLTPTLALAFLPLQALEADLDSTEDQYLPKLCFTLLYNLTLNTHINPTNWEEHLRRQYIKRSPATNQLGTLDDSRPWAELGLGDKIAALHSLCEWQMMDPMRFRGLVNDGEVEPEQHWRIEPSGYDRDGHAYYIFQDHRIWRKQPPLEPFRPVIVPRRSRNRHPDPDSEYSDDGKGKDRASEVSVSVKPRSSSHKRKRPARVPDSPSDLPSSTVPPDNSSTTEPFTSRMSRKRAAALKKKTGMPTSATPTKRSRTSRRSRGEDDTWQKIPQEWLSPSKSDDGEAGPSRRSSLKGAYLLSDEEEASDLSDLSESESEMSELTDEYQDEEMEVDEEEVAGGEEISIAKVEAAAVVGLKKEEIVAAASQDPIFEGIAVAVDPAEDSSAVVESNGTAVAKVESNANGIGLVPPLVAESEKKNVQFVEDVDMAEGEAPTSSAVEEEAVVEQPVMVDEEKPDVVQTAKNFVPPFFEWEAVCTCRYDWENYPLRWADSDDPEEKALFQLITIEYLPLAVEWYREKEAIKATALAAALDKPRQRSSRLQTLEAEKAEQDRNEAARTGAEVRMDKVRREEARKEQEEMERNERERMRVERLREREERVLQREEALREQREREEAAKLEEVLRKEGKLNGTDASSSVRKTNGKAKGGRKSTSTPATTPATAKGKGKGKEVAEKQEEEEDWILNCEICKKYGKNLPEKSALLCCEKCNEWQHVACHDKHDKVQGRSKTNWDKEDFKCSTCRKKEERKAPKKKEAAKMPKPKVAAVPTPPSSSTSSSRRKPPLPASAPAPASTSSASRSRAPLPTPPAAPAPSSSMPAHSPQVQVQAQQFAPPHLHQQPPPPPRAQFSPQRNGHDLQYYAPPPNHHDQPHPGYRHPHGLPRRESHPSSSHPPPPPHFHSPPYETSQMPSHPQEGPSSQSYHPSLHHGYSPQGYPPPHLYVSSLQPNGHSLPSISSLPFVAPPSPQSRSRPDSYSSQYPPPPPNATQLSPIDRRRASGGEHYLPPSQHQPVYYSPQGPSSSSHHLHGRPLPSMNGQPRRESTSSLSSGPGAVLPPIESMLPPPNGGGPQYRVGEGYTPVGGGGRRVRVKEE